VLAIRSEQQSLLKMGLFSNSFLAISVLATFALQLATLYLPAANPIFRTLPLDAGELVFCLAMSTVVLFGVEAEKWLVRRGRLYLEPVGR
jgi:Ca2+-transporting ATPase